MPVRPALSKRNTTGAPEVICFPSCLGCSVTELQPCGLQHAGLLCPPLFPRVCLNSCPLSQWCYLNILSSAALILSLPSIFPSIWVFFQWVGSSHQVTKVWSFSFSVSPSNEYSGLISFKIGWSDLLAVQGTPENLLQHHNRKASIL